MAEARDLKVWADVAGGISWDLTFTVTKKDKETGGGMDDRKSSRQKREKAERG